MPKSKAKFQDKWLSDIDSNGHQYSLWCRKGVDEFHAHCFICRKEFGCDIYVLKLYTRIGYRLIQFELKTWL